MKKQLIFLFVASLQSYGYAQEAAPASGGNTSGSGGSVSYSVGQVVYTTNTGTNGSVAQGVQQPYEISVVTGLEDAKGISLNCVAYPNPVSDFFKLKVEKQDLQNLSFQLFNVQGKLLIDQKITNTETSIVMREFASGNYFLKVNDNSKEIKTFKINKN